MEGPLLDGSENVLDADVGLCVGRIEEGSVDGSELGMSLGPGVGATDPVTLGSTNTGGRVVGCVEGSLLGIPENVLLGAGD
jgi:hypothetical protein